MDNKCYKCKCYLKGVYQVMIYNPRKIFVKCCSKECAEKLQIENASDLYDKYYSVSGQVIQVLRKEELSPREVIERFINKNGYTYKVQDILESYQDKFLKGYYVSYTMGICIENLENEIRHLLNL